MGIDIMSMPTSAQPEPAETLTKPWLSHYEASRIDIAVDAPGLRVLDATFLPGEHVPWHTHTNVVDHFWVLEGRLLVETTGPDTRHELGAGGYCCVQPGQPHAVTCISDVPCRLVNLQGFGAYDFRRSEGGNHG